MLESYAGVEFEIKGSTPLDYQINLMAKQYAIEKGNIKAVYPDFAKWELQKQWQVLEEVEESFPMMVHRINLVPFIKTEDSGEFVEYGDEAIYTQPYIVEQGIGIVWRCVTQNSNMYDALAKLSHIAYAKAMTDAIKEVELRMLLKASLIDENLMPRVTPQEILVAIVDLPCQFRWLKTSMGEN